MGVVDEDPWVACTDPLHSPRDLREVLYPLFDGLGVTLEEQISQMSEDKLDKTQLADQLINLAMQLKGESILNQIDKDFS